MLGLALWAAPWCLAAGQVRVAGRVVDSLTGLALELATISTQPGISAPVVATTDSSGAFDILVGVEPAHRFLLNVRRVGYSPRLVQVALGRRGTGEPLVIRLQRSPVPLAPVITVGERTSRKLRLSGFEDRRREGFGHFVTEADIAARRPTVMSDLFRVVPGVHVWTDGFQTTIRMARAETSRLEGGPCDPRILVDGMAVSPPFDLDRLIVPGDVAGIEVYRGPSEIPVGVGGAASACGVVVIWTK